MDKENTYGIDIKKFDMNKIHDHCTIAIIAKRGSGKSYLTRDILYHKKKYLHILL